MRESNAPWSWQVAMAVPLLVVLTTVKEQAQATVVALLLTTVVVQRVLPETRLSRAFRSLVMIGSTLVTMFGLGYSIAAAATPPREHPTMPTGEVALGGILAVVAVVTVAWLRWRGRDRWAERVESRSAHEPRLAFVIDLFAAVAVAQLVIASA